MLDFVAGGARDSLRDGARDAPRDAAVDVWRDVGNESPVAETWTDTPGSRNEARASGASHHVSISLMYT